MNFYEVMIDIPSSSMVSIPELNQIKPPVIHEFKNPHTLTNLFKQLNFIKAKSKTNISDILKFNGISKFTISKTTLKKCKEKYNRVLAPSQPPRELTALQFSKLAGLSSLPKPSLEEKNFTIFGKNYQLQHYYSLGLNVDLFPNVKTGILVTLNFERPVLDEILEFFYKHELVQDYKIYFKSMVIILSDFPESLQLTYKLKYAMPAQIAYFKNDELEYLKHLAGIT